MSGFGQLPHKIRAKVSIQGECWIWTGWLSDKGYAIAWVGKKKTKIHRLAYELLVGPIPEGLVPDHLCRRAACINPAHLECVTNKENILRGNGVAGINARKTHCIKGHAFTPENTQMQYSAEGRKRRCRTCVRARHRIYDKARRAK